MAKKGKRAKDKRKTSTAQFVQTSQLCSAEEMEGLHVLIVTSKEPAYGREIQRTMEEAIIAQREGHEDRAEQLYGKVLARNPNVKEAWGNLGALYYSRGEDERGQEYCMKALALDPLYVTARTNLASICLTEGRLAEARELLQPLAELREFHIEEIVRYQGVMARLALAEQRFDESKNHLKLILELDPEDKWALESLLRLSLFGQFADVLRGLGESARAHQKQHREKRQKQPISPGDPLLSLLSRYSKDALIGMAREIRLQSSSGLKKETLIAAIREHLLDAKRLPGILETLEEREQDALRFVLEAGGVMPLMEFVDRYGDDAGESPFWNWHVPNTTLGRLKIRGLLFEGTYEGQVVQVAPEELRDPCQALARQWERTISNE